MPLAVTGIGQVGALGYGATGTLAALRAGLSDPRELPLVVGGDEEGDIAAVGYPAADFADGFFQAGAWVRLATGAIEDLRHAAGLPTAADFWQRTALLAALPIIDGDRFRWTLEMVPEAPREFLLEPLADLAAPGVSIVQEGCHPAGHVALAAALQRADQGIAAREADRVLVAAADSYVDEWTLEWLASENRLKTGDRPTGLMPGEAGAALLLESNDAARRRHATIRGFVEAVALASTPPTPSREPRGDAEEDEKRPSPRPQGAKLGRAIAQAVRQVLPPAKGRFACDLYLDLNGEEWRAHGWGNAQVLLAREVDLDRCRTFLPAISIGEVGAAAAPVGLALALWNFDRDGTRDALVVSIADDGRVAAIRLSAPLSP
jgi:3-oxoacyl-[acyl-carrier-protein] synthase-1